MQREAVNSPASYGSFTFSCVCPRSSHVRPVSYGTLNTFCCVKLRCVTVFDGVDPVLLRISRYVTDITARVV